MATQEDYRRGTGQSPESIVCEGCGEPVAELARRETDRLRRTFTDEILVPDRAFECARCEAIIFSDELTLGKFVPPQFRTR